MGPTPPSGKRSLARQTRDLLACHPTLTLEYVQHRDSGKVHVLVPPDPDTEPQRVRGQLEWLGWLREDRPAVCGYRTRIYLGGASVKGDQCVTMFPDHMLCGGCLHLLGAHSPRVFGRPQPDNIPDD